VEPLPDAYAVPESISYHPETGTRYARSQSAKPTRSSTRRWSR
jgi:hypothetical protein